MIEETRTPAEIVASVRRIVDGDFRASEASVGLRDLCNLVLLEDMLRNFIDPDWRTR